MRRIFTTLFVEAIALCALASTALAQGRIIAIGDEWLLSDRAFTSLPVQTKQLTANIAAYFSGGGAGNFLAASNSPPGSYGARGVNGPLLAAEMQSLGHSWTIAASPVIDLPSLAPYDAVFFAGSVGSGPGNAAVLAQYVQNGGAVLVMAGTGDFGSAGSEAAAWNPLLNQFGLGFGDVWFAIGLPELHDVPVVDGIHPLNQSLDSISWGYGQLALDLDPVDPLNAVVVEGDFTGLELGPQGAINDVIAVYNVPVPEPTSLVLLLTGTLLAMAQSRRAPGVRQAVVAAEGAHAF